MPSLVQNAVLRPFWFVFADSGGPRIYLPTQWFQTLTGWKVAPITVFKLIPRKPGINDLFVAQVIESKRRMDGDERGAVLASKERDQSGLVRTHEEHPVVVHNADAKPVKPTGAAKEVSAECRILGEKDNRRKLNAKRLNGDLVLIGCERSSHGPKTLKPAGFNFQSEDLGVLALKDAMRGAGIQFSQQIDRLAPYGTA